MATDFPPLLWPLLTSHTAGCPASPFQARSEISPGKNADLPCTTVGSTGTHFGHNSFAVRCPLAVGGPASYPLAVRRLASSPRRFLHADLTAQRSAVCFARCDQLAGGLSPPSQRPCRAHTQAHGDGRRNCRRGFQPPAPTTAHQHLLSLRHPAQPAERHAKIATPGRGPLLTCAANYLISTAWIDPIDPGIRPYPAGHHKPAVADLGPPGSFDHLQRCK